MLKCFELERTFEVLRPTSSVTDEETETQQGQAIWPMPQAYLAWLEPETSSE